MTHDYKSALERFNKTKWHHSSVLFHHQEAIRSALKLAIAHEKPPLVIGKDGVVRPIAHQWQPMETAPKTGEIILLYFEGNVCQGAWFDKLVYAQGDKKGSDAPASWVCGWNWDNALVSNDLFTHWMPLPTPPEAK